VFNFAGSQELARQITTTHAADVFLSASESWMDHVERAGCVLEGTRTTFLSNRLVVVANPAITLSVRAPEDLTTASFEVLALGDPQSVPVGQYAKEWLERINTPQGTVWNSVKGRVSPSPNVRSALAMTEAHGGAIGIVYRTDIVGSTKVRVLYEVDEASGPKIRYSAAALTDRPAPRESAARQFVLYLRGPEARAHFAKEGFIVPP
jgi:molybdate transport system substrate-binding protein